MFSSIPIPLDLDVQISSRENPLIALMETLHLTDSDVQPHPLQSFQSGFHNRYWAAASGTITRIYRGPDGLIRRGKTSARKWGCENDLLPQAVEDAFSKIERLVAPLYKKLLDKKPLDAEERMVWSFWILCQFGRTPTLTLELAGFSEDVLQLFGMNLEASWAKIGNSFDSLSSHGLELPMSKDLLGYIVLRDWIVLRPAPGEFFIKGDTPVIISGPLVEDDSIVAYPMAPDACFVATVLGSFPPTQVLGEATLNPGGTIYYQKLAASKAEREAICNPENFSSALAATVSEFLGTDSKHMHHSPTPNW